MSHLFIFQRSFSEAACFRCPISQIKKKRRAWVRQRLPSAPWLNNGEVPLLHSPEGIMFQQEPARVKVVAVIKTKYLRIGRQLDTEFFRSMRAAPEDLVVCLALLRGLQRKSNRLSQLRCWLALRADRTPAGTSCYRGRPNYS